MPGLRALACSMIHHSYPRLQSRSPRKCAWLGSAPLPGVAEEAPAEVRVPGPAAGGGFGAPALLHLEVLRRGAVPGLEEVVEVLAALGRGLVHQQAAVAPPAADRAHAVERAA